MRIFEARISTGKLWLPVLLSAVLVHLRYIDNGFTWLDHGDIVEKRAVLPISTLGAAVKQPFGETGFYRPVVTVLHNVDAALSRC